MTCTLKLIVIKIKKIGKSIYFFSQNRTKRSNAFLLQRDFSLNTLRKDHFNSTYCVYYLKHIFDHDFDFSYRLKTKNLWGTCFYETPFAVNVSLSLLKRLALSCILDAPNHVMPILRQCRRKSERTTDRQSTIEHSILCHTEKKTLPYTKLILPSPFIWTMVAHKISYYIGFTS